MKWKIRKPPARYFDRKNNRIIHKAHHVQWHVKKEIFDEDCGWCQEDKK